MPSADVNENNEYFTVFIGQIFRDLGYSLAFLLNDLMGRSYDQSPSPLNMFGTPGSSCSSLAVPEQEEYFRLLALNKCVFVSDIAISVREDDDGFTATRGNNIQKSFFLPNKYNPNVYDNMHYNAHSYPIAPHLRYFTWYQLPGTEFFVYIFRNPRFAKDFIGSIAIHYEQFYPNITTHCCFPKRAMVFETSRFNTRDPDHTLQSSPYPYQYHQQVAQLTYFYSQQPPSPYRSSGPGFFNPYSGSQSSAATAVPPPAPVGYWRGN